LALTMNDLSNYKRICWDETPEISCDVTPVPMLLHISYGYIQEFSAKWVGV